MLLKNAVVYNEDFEPIQADLAVEGEKIAGIGQVNAGGECLDLSGYTIIPGLIDMHIHGCAGFDASDGTPEALEAMSRCLVERGVTSFCPTSMTLSFEALQKIFANVQEQKDKVTGAYIHGINMEGPYIAMSKKGAQNGAYVRNPDKEEFRRLYDGCGGCVSIVDIAPECDGAEAFIKEVQPYCPVSTAHTAAGYEQAVQAIEWGVRHTTHLYNAMSGLTHRAPGVVGAVFDMARLSATASTSIPRRCASRSISWARMARLSSAIPCALPAMWTGNTTWAGRPCMSRMARPCWRTAPSPPPLPTCMRS